ncbi:MAG: (deoxy)nucleoside triphosphate pyrophosphohydrolase [Bacteroidales bacterium]|nr:(deoxy)nucleoside triphosphate pyrophosphohydrolase [Bacteroidales bacterium]
MIRVTCAIIRNEENEVLVVQRGQNSDHPNKWEFPGGKLNRGETEEDCIIREIKEELSMDIVICYRLRDVEYDYGKKYILLIPFVCDTLDDLPLLSEHIAYKWLTPRKLLETDLSEADVVVAGNYIKGITIEENGSPDDIHYEESPMADDDLKDMVTRMISNREVDWIASSAVGNRTIFKKLLQYSWSGDQKLAFRSSWALSKVWDKDPESLYPYMPSLIESLQKTDNESVERSFLRIVSLSDMGRISREYHGVLAEHCFGRLRSGFSAIAIKAYSMEIIYKLAVIYPELANELSASVSMLQGEGSSGILARAKIILVKLAGITSDH